MVTKQVEESVREHCWLIEKKWVNIHLIVVSTLEIFGIRELMHCAIWLCIETEIVSEVWMHGRLTLIQEKKNMEKRTV